MIGLKNGLFRRFSGPFTSLPEENHFKYSPSYASFHEEPNEPIVVEIGLGMVIL